MKSANTGLKIIKKSNSNEVVVYRLCESWSDKIDYLKSELTDLEIKKLKTEQNGSMNIIGLITELEKNNNKEYAIEIIDNLLKTKLKHIISGCYDNVFSRSISGYFLYLLSKDNLLFKPDFKLKRKEIKQIKSRILIAENEFWNK